MSCWYWAKHTSHVNTRTTHCKSLAFYTFFAILFFGGIVVKLNHQTFAYFFLFFREDALYTKGAIPYTVVFWIHPILLVMFAQHFLSYSCWIFIFFLYSMFFHTCFYHLRHLKHKEQNENNFFEGSSYL